MNRRKFLGLGMTALALVPATSLYALDFRKEKPDAWTAKTVDDAIKALYGAEATESKDVTVKVPKVASNGGAVPVTIKSSIDAKTVALFQDANPESAVAVWTVQEGGIIDYTTKIKLKKSGSVIVVVEDKEGKLHSAKQSLEVALGGCEG